MENTPDAQELRSEFEINAEDDECVADAIYWGRMVEQASRFLDDIKDYLGDDASVWQQFLSTSDIEDMRAIYDYDVEMYVEDVRGALSDGTYAYMERAADLDELRNMLIDEWNPCSSKIESLRSEYKAKCRELCAQVKARAEAHFGL